MAISGTSVRTKLIALTIFFMADIAVLGFMSFRQTSAVIDVSKKLVDVDIPSVAKMGMVDMMHDGIRSNVLSGLLFASGLTVSTSEEILSEEHEFSQKITESLESLKALDLSPDLKNLVLKAEPGIKDYTAQATAINQLSLAKDFKKAVEALPVFQKSFEVLERDLGALGDEIAASSEKIASVQSEENRATMNLLFAFAVACLVFGGAVSMFVIRTTMKTVSNASMKLMEQANIVGRFALDVDSSAAELSKTVELQASNVHHSASTIHEISEMARLSSENALLVRESAISAVEVASNGKARVSEMVKIFSEVNRASDLINASVSSSNDQMSSVARVIQEISIKTQVINEIVFQTKLLSFNASVEAARAGEHGKGFAVVAEEVGKLARSSGEAAEQISRMLATSIVKVEDTIKNARADLEHVMRESREKIRLGEATARECDGILDRVVDVSQGVKSKIDQISGAIKEQSIGVTDMSKTLQALQSSISETHNQSKQSATHANGMTLAAGDMKGTSVSLRELLGVKVVKNDSLDAEDSKAA